MGAADAAQHDQDEERTGNVERTDQLGERPQRGDAVLPDRERQGTERTHRCETHKVAEDAEHHGRGRFQYVQHRLALLAHGRQRETAEHGNEQHGEHFTLVERPHEGVRDDVHEEVHHAQFGGRGGELGQAFGAQGGRVDVHADPWLEQVHRSQADDQADNGQPKEQQQRLAHQAPERALVGHAGYTGDDGAEHHGRDHHLDQLDEGIAQGLERNGLLRPEVTDHYAQHDGAEDLEVQRFGKFHEASPIVHIVRMRLLQGAAVDPLGG